VLPQPSYNLTETDSGDAAFLRLETTNETNVVLHLKDGTRIYFSTFFGQGADCEALPYLKIANKIVDTDGNIITIQSSGDYDDARVDSLTDTLGRVVNFNYPTGNLTSVSYKDSTAQTQSIALAYATFSIAPSFA
jgi:hypothetical protein